MKRSGVYRTCPECGRELETRINKLEVEVWPMHKVVTLNGKRLGELGVIYAENSQRPPGERDWELDCPLSCCPIDEVD